MQSVCMKKLVSRNQTVQVLIEQPLMKDENPKPVKNKENFNNFIITATISLNYIFFLKRFKSEAL